MAQRGRQLSKLERKEHGEAWYSQIAVQDGAFLLNGSVLEAGFYVYKIAMGCVSFSSFLCLDLLLDDF